MLLVKLLSIVTRFNSVKPFLLTSLTPQNTKAMYADGEVILDPCIDHGHTDAGQHFLKGAKAEVGVYEEIAVRLCVASLFFGQP